MLSKILDKALELGASDVHITEGKVVVYRVLGDLSTYDDYVVTYDDIKKFLSDIAKVNFDDNKLNGVDFSFTFHNRRFRGHIFYELCGLSLAIRVLNDRIATIDELGLPKTLYDVSKLKNGLFLVVGATGSGKSTSLAAIVEEINRNRRVNIITIEDPIEYIFQEKFARISQRELGVHIDSFSNASYEALRQDPDVVMIGEMRDSTTIQNALLLAETGHLVLSTLHANSVVDAIDRMLCVFSLDKQREIEMQIISVLRGVMYQQLIRTTENRLTPLCEVMIVNDTIRSLIKEKKTKNSFRDALRNSKNFGSIHMVDFAVDLYRKHLVTQHELELSLSKEDYSFFKQVAGVW